MVAYLTQFSVVVALVFFIALLAWIYYNDSNSKGQYPSILGYTFRFDSYNPLHWLSSSARGTSWRERHKKSIEGIAQGLRESTLINQQTVHTGSVPLEINSHTRRRHRTTGNMSPQLQQQTELHNKAYQAISAALDVDASDPRRAQVKYAEGIHYLRQALSLHFTPGEWKTAQSLAEKMKRNLASVEAREAEIRATLASSPPSPLTPTPVSTSPSNKSGKPKMGRSAKSAQTSPSGEAVMEPPREKEVKPSLGARLKNSLFGKSHAEKEKEKEREREQKERLHSVTSMSQDNPENDSAHARGHRNNSSTNDRNAYLGPTHAVTGGTGRTGDKAKTGGKKSFLTAGSGLGGGAQRPGSASNRGTRGPAGATRGSSSNSSSSNSNNQRKGTGQSDAQSRAEKQRENLKKLDPKMRDMILSEIVDNGPAVTWDDIAGLDFAKQTLVETVILPALRPEFFTDLRAPPKGILLFGPPGTGKTLLGKAVANESKSVFFSISAASLTSKYVGESEKMVRTLFELARYLAPSIIFIDEIDALLSARSSNEHEASRRLKTEFLVQLDGMGSGDERVLCMGATNRPEELDEAARRRLVKRIYIPLPDGSGRVSLMRNLLKKLHHNLNDRDFEKIARATKGYSGSDLTELCREAANGPIREHGFSLVDLPAERLRPVTVRDFEAALAVIRPSVDDKELRHYEEWNKAFGSAAGR